MENLPAQGEISSSKPSFRLPGQPCRCRGSEDSWTKKKGWETAKPLRLPPTDVYHVGLSTTPFR